MLLRDLSGKSSWDTTILYCELENIPRPIPCEPMEIHYAKTLGLGNSENQQPMSLSMTGNQILSLGLPRDALRHRPADQLPLSENSACDLDQLDDVSR